MLFLTAENGQLTTSTGSGPEARRRVNRSSPEVRSHTNGTLHRTRLPPLPPRRNQTLPQGHQVFLREMPRREAQLPPRPARAVPQGQEGRRLRSAASREAEGQAHLLHPRDPVPRL